MSKKRISQFLSLLIMGSLILAACAPAPQPATEPPTPQPQPTAEVIIQTVEVPIEVEAFPDGTELKILQWSHFVPQYDVWFDPFAKVWGNTNNIDVTVDHIALGELPAALTAAIDAGVGPSLVEMVFAPPQFIEGLHDLTDVNLQA